MILSDGAIRSAIRYGEISVQPDLNESDIRPVGIRLYLSEFLLLPIEDDAEADLENPNADQFISHKMDHSGYVLESRDFILACTREKIWTDRGLTCRLDGRSSIARSGLSVHCSSSVIDNIHEESRAIVLELYNCSRRAVRLRPGLAIAMLTFERLEGRILQDVSRQYTDQGTTLPPRRSVELLLTLQQ
jgi:dCTP deaminase